MTMMTLIVTITIIIILRSLVIICIDAYICLRKNIYIYMCVYICTVYIYTQCKDTYVSKNIIDKLFAKS